MSFSPSRSTPLRKNTYYISHFLILLASPPPFPFSVPAGIATARFPQPVLNESGSGAAAAAERVSAASVAAAAVAAGVDYLRFPAGAEGGGEDRPPATSDSIFKHLIPRKKCTVVSVAAVAVALLAFLIAAVIVPAVWPADPEAAAPVRTAAVVNIAAAIGAAIATGLAPVGGALSRM